MCGLVGVAGNLYLSERKAFRNLLLLDTFRGEHSTGIAKVNVANKIELFKEVGPPNRLYDTYANEYFDEAGIVKDAATKVLIGHNRFATMGKKTAENAHPFWHDHIIGAHNGTLEKYYLKNLDDHDKFEVDSEAIFYNISKNGIDATVPKIAGAYALVWWDREKNTVNFIRNKERPLFYARSKDKDAFFWASEAWMLEVGVKKAGCDFDEIKSFEVDTLYTLDVSKGTQEFRKHELQKEKELKGFTRPTAPTTVMGNGGHHMQRHMGGNNDYWRNHPTNQGNPFRPQQTSTSSSQAAMALAQRLNGKKTSNWKELRDKLSKYVGKSISFWSDMEIKSATGQVYLSCTPVNTEDDFEIRLYTKDRQSHNDYRNARTPLIATIKKLVHNSDRAGNHELYFLVDYRTLYVTPSGTSNVVKVTMPPTIAEEQALAKQIMSARSNVVPFTPSKMESKRGDFRGHNGVPYTEEEWIHATHQGCAYCDKAVEPEEAKELKWFGTNDFLCGTCAADPEAAQYAY